MDKKNQVDENECITNGPKDIVWKFVHYKDFKYKSGLDLNGFECDFEWLKIEKDGSIIVKGTSQKGYAWNGCTPKKIFLHITWGIFDGKLIKHKDFSFGQDAYKPYTYYASMLHDVLYQYKKCIPITRKQADKLFFKMLKESGFMWKVPYFMAVRLFGCLSGSWKSH